MVILAAALSQRARSSSSRSSNRSKRKVTSTLSAVLFVGAAGIPTLLISAPAQAGCNPFGCSQSSNAECNPFGCPNAPLGQSCTPFGCPASPQPQYEQNRGRTTSYDDPPPRRSGRSLDSLVYECAGILQSQSITAGFSNSRAESLCQRLVEFESITRCSNYLRSNRVRENFTIDESIRVCERVVPNRP